VCECVCDSVVFCMALVSTACATRKVFGSIPQPRSNHPQFSQFGVRPQYQAGCSVVWPGLVRCGGVVWRAVTWCCLVWSGPCGCVWCDVVWCGALMKVM
jgi:hypothetical protein